MLGKRKLRTIRGEKFLRLNIKNLCDIEGIEYSRKMQISHITYDKSVNTDYQYKMVRQIIHDGTLVFEFEALNKMFGELLHRQTVYDMLKFDKQSDIHYLIGDVKIINVYRGTSMGQTFIIPIRCIVKSED